MARLSGWAGPAAGLILAAASQPALAGCISTAPHDPPGFPNNLTANYSVTCSGAVGTRVGQGPLADRITLNISDGATILVTNSNAISLGVGNAPPNNAIITLGTGAGPAVVIQTTTNGGANGGQYGTGDNTIEFDSNTKLIINKNASVIATGTQTSSEAINPYGSGNTIVNYGLIQGGPSSAIFFENVNTSAASPRNVVDNFGTILAPPGPNPTTSGEAIGSFHDVGIDIINETGAVIKGNLDLQGGNDTVTLLTGSSITGNLNGGGGTNTLTLDAPTVANSDSFTGQVNQFQTLTKTGAGTWTLTGAIGNNGGATPLAVEVAGGTLVLTGNNASFNGSVTIDSGATLEARAQSLPPVINDLHGDLLINQVSPDGIQPNDGTYAGVVNGSGIVTKIGVGTVTLTGVNTYSGGTIFDVGAIAVAADSALGAPTGPLTFNGGALQLLSSFNLSASRPIVLNGPNGGYPGGGTIDANGFQTTISQGITGAGGLTVTDSTASTGQVILTGANTYAGGTTISAGTLQLGNGGTSGSIVGNVTDNGTLAFNRSDVSTFSGVVSGTGSLAQIGSGTTVLTATNTYTGGTTISAGTLQLGNGGTSGSIVGNVTDNGTLAFNRSDVSTFSGVVSGMGSLTQIGTGTTVLTAANTYTGGTTISAGTLQLGNGGTSGSIVGNVTDNGTLAFNRSDIVTFPGVISGTGGVNQIGTGTTILNALNPYTGPTNVSAGVLAIGDAAHPSASLSGGGPVSVAGGATLGGYGGVAGNVTSAGTVAVGNAVPAFDGGPTGAFTIGGNFQNAGVAQIGGSGIGNILAVNGNYGTGSGAGVVNINTLLNEGGPLSNQHTDRLLIFGNASGATTVAIKATGTGAYTSAEAPSATSGISVIQVAGTSSASTFNLSGGYVTGGTPYQYKLFAYGPGSANGPASATQSLVGNAGGQWDYRLENVYVTPTGPITPPEPPPPDSRPEVAPQVPAYITLPTALFNAGFQDLDNLHRRLGEIRDDQGHGQDRDFELFIRGYGSMFNYSADRSFQSFGYNSTQDYAATQLGGNYIAHRNASGTLRVGLAATLGQLWFQPQALDGASSGLFNTYSFAGTATWQSTAGWYVDAILSGGLFTGSIASGGRAMYANMNGTSFAGSLEVGYPIPLGWEGVALEPQAQFVYQNLNIAPRTDSDGITARLGTLDQGVFRGGARLTRSFLTPEGDLFTPYLKANVLTGIGGGEAVSIGNVPFLTGRFGTSLQVGGGATGKITHNLSIYGDVAWQDGVGGGGARGWVLNGGLRYAF